MSSNQKNQPHNYERYDLSSSPFAQNPTQKKFAELVGLSKANLEGIISHKEQYIIRRVATIKGKERNLIYPFGRFRRIHESLKFHFSKIKQPDYVYSPRKGKTIRDNALLHTNQRQFLKIDIKQFYPSTSSEHVYRWARYALGMRDDVAGLFVHVATIDRVVSFGSPLTPVLATLIHRKMFDAIAAECASRGLRISIWVDDITISGNFVSGELVDKIRDIVRSFGLKTHKLQYATGSRSVAITGIMIRGSVIDAPRVLHDSIREGYAAVLNADNKCDAELIVNKLLSQMGRYRYIVGGKSRLGLVTSNRLNTLRQRKRSLLLKLPEKIQDHNSKTVFIETTDESTPF